MENFTDKEQWLGEIAYNAYCEHTEWKSAISGQQLPSWQDNPYTEAKVAWIKAAKAVK